MNCESYINLTPLEKATFIGKVVHLLQSDENWFKYAEMMVYAAERNNEFETVTFFPEADL
jgi:siderophore synthetase component